MIVVFGILGFLTLAVLVTCYICFRMAFYAPRKPESGEFTLPDGDIYEAYREPMTAWANQVRKMPHEDMEIVSFDGLILRGKFYEYAPGAPIELMFHGYRGAAERDLCGGVQRCFKLGHSALIVDQRCAGGSDGHTITFGIKEHKDALCWVDFMVRRFGPEVRIILCGLSMGASTVMMAAGKDLPEQVVGVLADCGYSSAKEIIGLAVRQMGIPVKPGYFFARLGARIYGGFDPEETSPVEALKQAKVPVIFFHGEADDFVPCYMSKACFDACASRKRLVTVPGAGHGLSYPTDPQGYIRAVREFFGPELCPEKK